MKRLLCCLVLLVIILPSCANTTSIQTELGKEFTLAIGQKAVISVEDLSVKLTDIVGDSRCPSGVTCIWAGQVSCVLDITQKGKTYQDVITASGGASDYGEATYQNYIVRFRVDPYPQSGKTIKKSDYRLVITINKQS
jgi:hypothetical protein